MALTLDPNWFPARKVLEKILGIMEKCREKFFALFSTEKICAGRTFSPTAEFFLSEKILLTHLVVV